MGSRTGIFQSFNLIGDLTVFENVELPLTYRGMRPAERRQRVNEALERDKIDIHVGNTIEQTLVNLRQLFLRRFPEGTGPIFLIAHRVNFRYHFIGKLLD